MKHIQVGVIGFGTVGTGVVRALLEKPRLLQRRVGTRLALRWVCDRDMPRPSGFRLPAGIATIDPQRVIDDPEVQIIVEVIGGIEPARTLVLNAIKRGKHVVTANKALLAEHGQELFAAANKHGVQLAFEASVGGGIPIIKILREGLVANDVDTIIGIVNGTSNYILSQMRDKGMSFHESLLEAKRHGYAERNPSLDINGNDAAHKLAILAQLAFGVPIRQKDIYIEGISSVSQADIQYANEMGYRIKPLVIAKEENSRLEVRVHPTLLEKKHLLANVSGVYNAVYIHGDLVGSQLFYGRGAGQNPTASAVISDIADAARLIASGNSSRNPIVPTGPHRIRSFKRMGEVQTRYYMRFTVIDKPGVLARIAGILGRCRISLASVHQKERKAARIVPVVMMTDEVKESDVRRALRRIDRLPFVKQPTVAIRTEEPSSR